MNFERLIKLADLLADTESKLRRYNGQDKDPVLGDMYDSLAKMTNNFAHHKEISNRARLRILRSMAQELQVIRGMIALELAAAPDLPQDLATSPQTGAGSVHIQSLQP